MPSLINLKPRQNSNFTKKLSIFMYVCYSIFFIIFLRFFYLQVINYEHYKQRSERISKQEYPLQPPRGLIYDRNNVLMAKNKPSYNLALIPSYLPTETRKIPAKRKGIILKRNGRVVYKKIRVVKKGIFEEIAKKFDIKVQHLHDKVFGKLDSYRPQIIRENLSKKKILYLEENKNHFSYLTIIEYPARIYPFGESSSHILGYIGMIGRELRDLAKKHKDIYHLNSVVGKNGLEKNYDLILRGIEGKNVRLVTSIGKPIKDLPEKSYQAVPGKNVVLSIDSNVQDFAYSLLYRKKGAIVVSKPATGEIIALVSSPGYDANLSTKPNSRKQFRKLMNHPDDPFLNRPIQGTYAPGSTFKIVTAIAGLEDGKINVDERINCKGIFEHGDRRGGNAFKDNKIHGVVDIFKAIAQSCNVYFYQLGYKLGYASILEYAGNMGLNRLTGLDIPGEKVGLIPTPEWKENYKHEQWYDGDTINASIGQGFITLTPIAANNIISIIAAGKVMKPRILWKIKNPYTGIIEKEYTPKLLTKFKLGKKTLKIIREGLKRAPLTGTAVYHKWLSKVPIAGKTGSAQNVKTKTHSWFISYGPLDKPLKDQYAVTVMVESSGHGGSIAVPIASMIYNLIEGKLDRDSALRKIYDIFKYQESK